MQLEAQPSLQVPVVSGKSPWKLGTRIAFRFAFVSFILYTLRFDSWFVFAWFVSAPRPVQYYEALQDKVVLWVGSRLLQLGQLSTNEGSDSTFATVWILCCLFLAGAATILWSVLDRRRRHYSKLYQWFRLYLRWILISAMFYYGIDKVLLTQFTAPQPSQLLRPLGEYSRFWLLWLSMGAAPAYAFFAGTVEVLAGILLMFPRFTTLGAMLSLGAMANVFMLDVGFNVPIKTIALRLLAISALLLLPDWRRLANLFLLNRPTDSVQPEPLFQRKWPNRAFLTAQVLFGAFLIVNTAVATHKQHGERNARAPQPVYGVWSVDEFQVNGEARAPLLTDKERWQRVVFDAPDEITLQDMRGELSSLDMQLDVVKKTILLSKKTNPRLKAALTFAQPGPNQMILDGEFEGRPVHAKLQRSDAKFAVNAPFRWNGEF
jgi:hypothetical protein